jgi:hypothetical protein
MAATLPDVPGIAQADPAALRALVEVAARRGWNADGMAAAISEESGWRPDARNPGSDASGYVQIVPLTAGALGTTTEEIRAMSGAEQVALAERYWLATSRGRPIGPWDWLVLGLGVGNAPDLAPRDLPDAAELYAAGSAGARGNPGLQDSDGAIRVGSVRRYLQRYAERSGRRVQVPAASLFGDMMPRSYGAGGTAAAVGAVAGVELLFWLGLGGLVYLRRRRGR